jgi:anti-sigma factor RsiW
MKNCAQTREALAGLLYGELSPAEIEAVHQHLADCPPCRAEQAALRQVQAALNAAPVPEVAVDLPRLYHEAARRAERRLRRWRRVAVGALAAAAVLIVVFGLGLEVRLEQHQVVLRWGTPPRVEPPPPKTPAEQPPVQPAAQSELQLIKDLIHLLAADVQTQEQQHQEGLRRLQRQLELLRVQLEQRSAATERDVSALYTAQFGPRDKGEKP